MAESRDGCFPTFQYIDPQTVAALEALVGRAVSSVPAGGYFQVWCYVQVEHGRVAQVGVSPVVGESIRFADGGRRSKY